MKIIEADNYQIYIGDKSISNLNISKYSQVAILVDENTKKKCLPILLEKNNNLKDVSIIEINSGEENKHLDTCKDVWERLIKCNFDKKSLLINLGGGVIGDLGGYCASNYKRGISFIQIPTTLLAMTDASIGGKLGVNFYGIKNQIGLFNNPESVLIYPDFLTSLSKIQLKSGFAEIVKHALISDKKYWKFLKENNFKDLDWEVMIYHSVNIKNTIVCADPKEKNERKKLNFGHTFAHAIESYYLEANTPILHGDAVFMGMLIETEMSNLTVEEKKEIKEYILSNFDLPHCPQKSCLTKFMKNDKKNINLKINFSLLNGIGACSIDNLFLENEI